MKKTIIIIAAVFVLLVAALFLLPVFFKQNILQATKSALNKSLNAEVEFADLNLSLFRNFPKATIVIKKVSVVGKGEFSADTLVNVESLQATMNLSSIFKKSGRSVDEIILSRPILNFVVSESETNNWDIVKADSSQSVESGITSDGVEQESDFELQLEKIKINNGLVIYNDRAAKMLLQFAGLNFDVSGKMYGTSTELLANGKVDDFLLNYGGTDYIQKTSLETKTLLDVNYETMKFSIMENELFVNRLPLEVTGNVEMPSDSMFFNLQIKTKESDFENFLALVPPVYEEYLKDMKTSGSATVSGRFEGLYFEDNYPELYLNMDVKNGTIHYADLPEKIEKIRADVIISKPQGDFNLTTVTIKDAHAEVKNSPVDFTLSLSNLIEDLHFDGALVGKVNFNDLKDALPLDSVNISGIIDANLFVKGNYSAVEKEEYDKIKSDGIVLLDNFIYDSPELSQRIFVPQGKLDFSPANINLRQFNMKIGQSDFNLTGIVSNYLNYFLKDGIITGELQLRSSMVNINELLRLQIPDKEEAVAQNTSTESSTKAEDAKAENLAFDVPKNVALTFRTNIDKAVLDKMLISDIKGQITAKNGKLLLDGLNMKMLEGEMNLTGSYQNTPENQPLFDFGFDVIRFDIPAAYQSLTGIQKMLTVAAHSEGKLNAAFKMNGQMSANHKIIPSSIDGSGQFQTLGLHIMESPVFQQLKGILKSEKLRNVAIDDFMASFKIDNGNIDLKPFKTKIAGQETILQGQLSAQNLLNLKLDFNVQRDAFGTDIQNILSIIPGNQNITVVPAGVIIRGPVGDPEVKLDLSETRKTVTDATKGEIQKSLKDLGKGLKKMLGN